MPLSPSRRSPTKKFRVYSARGSPSAGVVLAVRRNATTKPPHHKRRAPQRKMHPVKKVARMLMVDEKVALSPVVPHMPFVTRQRGSRKTAGIPGWFNHMLDELPRELAIAEAEAAIGNVERKIREARKAKKARQAKHQRVQDSITRRRHQRSGSPKK